MICDNCGKKEATINFQKVWISWKIESNGDYSTVPEMEYDVEEPIDEENQHLCEDCEELFRDGKI